MIRTADRITNEDNKFLTQTASHILAGSRVATTTAERLAADNVDVARLAHLLKTRGPDAEIGGFKFKLIDADPETPDNFGVLVRELTTHVRN